jgi:hypothetical protein
MVTWAFPDHPKVNILALLVSALEYLPQTALSASRAWRVILELNLLASVLDSGCMEVSNWTELLTTAAYFMACKRLG